MNPDLYLDRHQNCYKGFHFKEKVEKHCIRLKLQVTDA